MTERAEALGARRSVVAKFGDRLGFALFFLMLFVPTAYQPIKAALMVAVTALIVVGAVSGERLALDPRVAVWTLFSVTVGAAFMLRGQLAGAPGAFRVGSVYVLWPIVYTLLVAGAADRAVLRGLARTMVVATVAIGAYVLTFVLHTVGWLPGWLYLPLDQGQAVGFYKGFVELNLYSLASLLFLVPFAVACLMTWPGRESVPVRRRWLWIALAWGLVSVLLSGRRALLLTVALAAPITVAFRAALPTRARAATRTYVARFALGAAVVLVALVAYLQAHGVTVEGVARMFAQGFDFSRDVSASARRLQLDALLAAWAEAPMLGAGHGAAAAGYLRSHEMPWAYELSFVALLFHTGLVGFAAYAAGVAWIVWSGLRVIRSGDELARYVLPFLVGMSCFLLGSATNPYLEKFDALWAIFLPVAVVNLWLLERARSGVGR